MSKMQDMAKAVLDFASEHAADNGVAVADAMDALAHAYVIFGFSLKRADVDGNVLKEALLGAVAQSSDYMMMVEFDEEA